MKAFITGIAGFAGSYLTEHLLRHNLEVMGTIRHTGRTDHISHLLSRIRLFECDLRDSSAVQKVIREAKPNLIFHLAAQSYVPFSWNDSMDTLNNNLACQIHLLDAVRRLDVDCKTLIVGSSEQYGFVRHDELPIKETNPFRPLNPYAVSKIAQEYMGYQYYKTYGLHIVTARSFHHTGPGRGENFVTSNFAKQIVEIEYGLKPPVMYVGNLEAKREFMDVRDVVRAYRLALELCDPGEAYNIASGECVTVREMLDLLLSLSKAKIDFQVDASRLRPIDTDIIVGDYTKFHAKTGWTPDIPFQQTMEDLLNHWRSLLANQ